MENTLPELSRAAADSIPAAGLVLIAVRAVSVALNRRELRFSVASSRHRWQSSGGRMQVHTYSDEWFFQLRGVCAFEFPDNQVKRLTSGNALLVPRGIPHAEYAASASDGEFTNLVMVVGEDSTTIHVATTSEQDNTLPDVYKQVKLNNVEFYRGLTVAAAADLSADTANRLLECLFFQLERDVSSITEEDAAPAAKHYLAARARKLVEACPVNRWYTVTLLASKLNCSPNYLSTLFRKNYGITLKEFLIKRRLENARIMLLDGSVNASEAAAQCGFEDAAYFARIFRRRFGHSPSQLRKTLMR